MAIHLTYLTSPRNLFAADAGVFGWPSDGTDETCVQAAEFCASVAKTPPVTLASGVPSEGRGGIAAGHMAAASTAEVRA